MLSQKTYQIAGMTCASCVSRVEKALLSVAGVESATVNLATETAQVNFKKTILDAAGSGTQEAVEQAVEKAVDKAVEKAIKKSGYEILKESSSGPEVQLKQQKIKLWLSIALTLPLVLPMIFELVGIHEMLPFWVELTLASFVQFYIGAPFYRGAFSAIKALSGNMDLLVALGTTAAYGYSLYFGFFSQAIMPELYFESASVIITLVLLGKYFEFKSRLKASASIRALAKLKPSFARVQFGAHSFEMPMSGVKLNDQVVVLPGERIPVDGRITEGSSDVDESLLTGESLSQLRKVGDPVTGGSLNGAGRLVIRTTRVGQQTFLSQITELIENAQTKKAPIQKLVDRVSAVFVPFVILIALATALFYGLHFGDWNLGLLRAVSVLVISCPCALGLATPTAILVGTSMAAEDGILIRDVTALEVAEEIQIVVFDKTGTLTEGKQHVAQIEVLHGSETEFLEKVAALESGSEHSLAKSFLAFAKEKTVKIAVANDLKVKPGYGVEGTINGVTTVFGNAEFMSTLGLTTPKNQSLKDSGILTRSYLADLKSKIILGSVSFQDQIRPSAVFAIQALKKLGLKTVMLTGDHIESANHVANELKIDEVKASLTPESKLQELSRLKSLGRVAMVGDGINDAPSLAAADIGIALSSGTDVAMEAAPITLMRPDLNLVAEAILISRKTQAKIKQNLFFAFFYNMIGIPLAMHGNLSPMVAGAAMAMSSVSVVGNALLLKRGRKSVQINR